MWANFLSLFRILLFLCFTVFIFCKSSLSHAQQSLGDSSKTIKKSLYQNIRGKVVDKQTQYPIVGAIVTITSLNPMKGTTTDLDGDFKISEVSIGRHFIKVTYLGYTEQVFSNLLVTAGKELIVNFELEEQVVQNQEVIVTAEKDKTKPNNEMAAVSARSFTIEETSRYSGSLNDPARMAMNFAGVSGTSDARNDIIIRGNSPLGLLWRLEGIDIPSPNHFGAYGTTGGPIGMLNNNVLSNSDFLTSAFPANYGNALSGVFDLKMRKGNLEKREYLAQIGFNGLEFGLEGPFSKKSKASYLANYRYSTLGLFKMIGISFGTSALPQYQDLNFKIDLPINQKNKISIFGLGGISNVRVDGNLTDSTDLYSDRGYNQSFNTGMGVVGLNHVFFFNPSASLKTSLAGSLSTAIATQDSIPQDENGRFFPSDASGKFIGEAKVLYRSTFKQYKYTFNQSLNYKLSSKNFFSIGYFADIYSFSLTDSILRNKSQFFTLRDFTGASMLIRSYAQWQHKFTEHITLNTGLQYQYFAFNATQAIEPRIGFKYQLLANQFLNFGYGLHSQLQPFQIYFKETPIGQGTSGYFRSNKDLEFVRSHQFVLGYDYLFSKNMRLKLETYYQYIFNAAVERKSSSYSMLNAGADFGIPSPDNLINNGKGENYGIELTLERFYHAGYYFLITNSIFNSLYTGSDGVQRGTGFNNNHILNVLAGKEFKINTRFTISLDFKIAWAGGRRYTPIDIEKSRLLNQEVRIENKAYEGQFQDYFRPDVKLSFRWNGKKITQELYFDVQNVINRKNPFTEKYSIEKKQIIVVNQLGIFPVLQYRVTF
ncbi:MAG: TonB-dependent receptor [Cytophagales bacterium]|nr:MAG: TonB-dependent receptor [Cytophagales bacterium]